jgi:hypothetical protein
MPSSGIAAAAMVGRANQYTRHGRTPVTDALSGRSNVLPLDVGIQGNQAFAIPRGSPDTPSQASGPGRRFPGMLLSPSPFGPR